MSDKSVGSGHESGSGRFGGLARSLSDLAIHQQQWEEDEERRQAGWKTYKATVHVTIKAPDETSARRALESVRAFREGRNWAVQLVHEGPYM